MDAGNYSIIIYIAHHVTDGQVFMQLFQIESSFSCWTPPFSKIKVKFYSLHKSLSDHTHIDLNALIVFPTLTLNYIFLNSLEYSSFSPLPDKHILVI